MTVLENVAIGAHLRGHAGASPACSGSIAPTRRDCWRKPRRQIDASASATSSISCGKPVAGPAAHRRDRAGAVRRPLLLLLDSPARDCAHGKAAARRAAPSIARRRHVRCCGRHDMGFVMNLATGIVVLDSAPRSPKHARRDQDQIRCDQRPILERPHERAAVGRRRPCFLRQGRSRGARWRSTSPETRSLHHRRQRRR